MPVTAKPQKINYKYDLMHLNTPSFASTVITWDLSKVGAVVRNRVIRWLRQGYTDCYGGESKALWLKIRDGLEIPHFFIRQGERTTRLEWSRINDEVYKALSTIYHTERVITRLQGEPLNWNLEDETLSKDREYLYLHEEHDFTELKCAIKDMMRSNSDRIEQAINFLESGGKLTFTWR